MTDSSKSPSEWSRSDLKTLRRAKGLLESPGLAARLTNVVGSPIEKAFGLLPENWAHKVQSATRIALTKALNVAVNTLGNEKAPKTQDFRHKLAVAVTGGVGGAFGILTLPVELPLSTTIMLRSIGEIAKSEGEDLSNVEARLACIEVFALGGSFKGIDAPEVTYFAVRAALARTVAEAAEFIAQKGIVEEASPVLVRLLSMIGVRFGVVVGEKVAAIAVPIIGAAGGSIINTLFMDHFQTMAHGHFAVRRLERIYGAAEVEKQYGLVVEARRGK